MAIAATNIGHGVNANAAPRRLHWRDLIRLSNDELARFDIAVINLACAAGLPGVGDVDIQAYVRTLDQWAAWIAEKTRTCAWFKQDPAKYDHSEGKFRIHVMIAVLQLDFGVRYNPACMDDNAPFGPHDVFLPGILEEKGGTCASLPVLYAAIGRRLGYPIKLARAPRHQFARWDEPNGERFNIEASNKGYDTPSDDYYRTGRYKATPAIWRDGCFLKSMTPREELANSIKESAGCWLDLGNYRQAAEAYIQAALFAPEYRLHWCGAEVALKRWRAKVTQELPPNFPQLAVAVQPRRFPGSPPFVEMEYAELTALEHVLHDPDHLEWWEALRKSPYRRPAHVPSRISIKFGNHRGLNA